MYTTNYSIAVGEIHNALCLPSKVDHQMIKAVLLKVIPRKDLLTSLLLMHIWAILPMYIMKNFLASYLNSCVSAYINISMYKYFKILIFFICLSDYGNKHEQR